MINDYRHRTLRHQLTPIHLRDEILIQLALMQYYDIITLLQHSIFQSIHRR